MDLRARMVAVAAGLMALTACSPLPQAALVYSSRVSFGVTVTSAPASASGPTLSIGYDQLDAAYVPVSVAGANKSGTSDLVLEQIRAKYSNDQQPQGQQDAANLAKVNDYLQAAKTADATKSSIQALSSQKAPIDPLKSQVAVATSRLSQLKAARLDTKEAASQLQEAKGQLVTAQTANQAIDSQIKQLTPSLTVAEQEAAAKRPAALEAAKQLGLVREDALSVYGRFDGKSDAQTATVGLAIGKVFSTGIAAQSLAEGAGRAAAMDAYTNCLLAAKAAGSDGQKCTDLSAASTGGAR